MGGRENPGAVIVGHFHSLGAARNLARHDIAVYVVDAGQGKRLI
jgi:hypothetical protein